ncbi:hypothetical protein BJ912DRAFT_1054687 [Pholiota molesta]|nr:hypothetical protein BJ912DRAFT_1054687 [Pholiota molesta]
MQLPITLLTLLMAAYATAQDTVSDPNATGSPPDASAAPSVAVSSMPNSPSSAAPGMMSQLSSMQSSAMSSMSSVSSSSVQSSASIAISSIASQVSTSIRPTGTLNSGGGANTNAFGGGAALALVGFVAALV